MKEMHEKHKKSENLRKVKSLDELTGLYNRNTYYDRVRCRFENEPDKEYVIVCFDVEKFKFVNDRFGFVEGDRLLSYIGKKLQERAAKYGLVAARLSGDVFSFMDFEENIQPDALGAERVALYGCKLDELTLMDWENGKITEKTISFTYENYELLDVIIA